MEPSLLSIVDFGKFKFRTLVKQILDLLNLYEEPNVLKLVNSFFCFYKLYSNSKKLFHYSTQNKDILETFGFLRFMRLWIVSLFDKDFYPHPTRINKIIKILKKISKNSSLISDINKVKLALLRKNKQQKYFSVFNPPKNIKISQPFFSFPPFKIAEQLIIIEAEILNNIHLSEFIIKYKNKTTLDKAIERANQISFWVASNILAQRTISNQIKVIRFFLDIAQFCEIYGNFNSIFNIMAGFQLHYVSRLRENWKLKTQSALMMNRFQTLTNPEHNYKTYRQLIAKRPNKIIPYLGIIKRDISLIHEGNPTYIEEKINKNKIELISKIIENTTGLNLNLEKDDQLRVYLLSLIRWSEDKIEKRSKEIKHYKSEEVENPYADYSIDTQSNKSEDSSASDLVEVGLSEEF